MTGDCGTHTGSSIRTTDDCGAHTDYGIKTDMIPYA